MTSRELLGDFLDDVWGTGNAPRKVYLAYKPQPTHFDIPPGQLWPAKKNAVLEFILGTVAKGQNIYFSPALYASDSNDKKKESVRASRVLWCDFDGNAKDALVRLKATPDLPQPSWRISSGLPGHEHWYWILDRPEGVQRFEEANRKLAYYLEGDVGCWNADRVMRPPFTTNFMDAKKYHGKNYKPQPVDFIEKNDTKYSIARFDFLPDVRDSIIDNLGDLGEIPPMVDVLANYKWQPEALDMFKNPPTDTDRSTAIVRIAYYCAEAGMPDEAIYAVINDFDVRVGKFTGRADRERQLARIIAKVRVKHPYSNDFEINQTKENIQLIYTANALMHSEFKLDWLVDKLIPKKGLCLITAEPGIGKSRLSMQLAYSLATGTKFLKYPVERPMSVVYLSLEMPGDMLKHFLSNQLNGKDLPADHSDNYKLIPLGRPLNILSEEGFTFIETIISDHRPEVMFIDALGSLTFEELGEVQSKDITNRFTELTSKYGTTFFVIHHNRKPDLSGKKRPNLGDVYGSQYIAAHSDLVLSLFMPENQAHVELITLKSRAVAAGDYVTLNGKKGFHFIERKDNDSDSHDNSAPDFSL
jgi:archaellum biogenesis ATPase FlaH